MSANERYADQFVKMGMGMLIQSFQGGEKADNLQNRIAFGGRVSSDILPAVKNGQLKGNDIPKALNELGGEYGLDPLESIGIYNDIWEVADEGGLSIKELLDIEKKEIDISRAEIGRERDIKEFERAEIGRRREKLKLGEEAKTEPEREVDIRAAEDVAITSENLKSVWRIARNKNTEDVVDDLDDLYPDAGIDDLSDEDKQDRVKVASVLADYLYANDIEGFIGYSRNSIIDALSKMISNPKTYEPEKAFKRLQTAVKGRSIGRDALLDLSREIGG